MEVALQFVAAIVAGAAAALVSWGAMRSEVRALREQHKGLHEHMTRFQGEVTERIDRVLLSLIEKVTSR